MMDPERFIPYWRVTSRLTFVLVGFLFLLMSLGLGFSHIFDRFQFLGFPVGVLLSGHFVVVLIIGLMFWFTGTQDHVDNDYGANEDL